MTSRTTLSPNSTVRTHQFAIAFLDDAFFLAGLDQRLHGLGRSRISMRAGRPFRKRRDGQQELHEQGEWAGSATAAAARTSASARSTLRACAQKRRRAAARLKRMMTRTMPSTTWAISGPGGPVAGPERARKGACQRSASGTPARDSSGMAAESAMLSRFIPRRGSTRCSQRSMFSWNSRARNLPISA